MLPAPCSRAPRFLSRKLVKLFLPQNLPVHARPCLSMPLFACQNSHFPLSTQNRVYTSPGEHLAPNQPGRHAMRRHSYIELVFGGQSSPGSPAMKFDTSPSLSAICYAFNLCQCGSEILLLWSSCFYVQSAICHLKSPLAAAAILPSCFRDISRSFRESEIFGTLWKTLEGFGRLFFYASPTSCSGFRVPASLFPAPSSNAFIGP